MNKKCPKCGAVNMPNGSFVWQCSACKHYVNESTGHIGTPESRGGRIFSDQVVVEAWLRQNKKCALCGDALHDITFQAHHMRRWADGGNSTVDNCVLLCDNCHYTAHNNGRYAQPFELLQSEYQHMNGKKKTKE